MRTIVLQPGDDLAQLAEAAAQEGADVLGMAGGDGSQALVARVAMKYGIALDLGLERHDVPGTLDAFAAAVERRVDVARVNDHIFVNNVSMGVYAGVIESQGYRGAKLRTWWRVLPDLLGPHARPAAAPARNPNLARPVSRLLCEPIRCDRGT